MSFDLGIVGAGPAGMSAAIEARSLGLSVVVVDEQQRPGGQIFRQPRVARGTPAAPVAGYRWGPRLVHDAEQLDGVEWRLGCTVIAVLDTASASSRPLGLTIRRGEALETIQVDRLLIATGAMDLPVAFPGWTLPGVMTAGGVQTMLKAQGALPIDDVVLAGGHPLLLVVADLLLAKGATISGLAFPRPRVSPDRLRRGLAVMPTHLGIMTQAARAIAKLVGAGVPVAPNAVVSAARGDGRVEEVEIARVLADGTLEPTASRTTRPAGGVIVGYGFQPSTDLARQAGCRLRWDPPAGGWVVEHDPDMRTSVDGVYVAGEPTGVGGAEQARSQGALAALCIAESLGRRDPLLHRRTARARAEVGAALRFSDLVRTVFEPPRDLLNQLARHDTLVCRCESVSRRELEQVIDDNPFITGLNALKLECRVGMGPCQGRYCELSAGSLLAEARGVSPAAVGPLRGQFPARPVTVAEVSSLDDNESAPIDGPAIHTRREG